MKVNKNYANLKESYLFATIGKKVREYTAANPDKSVIRMGIGDVTRPLAPAVIGAMQKAVSEMGVAETFRGYGDDYGYDFLRTAISDYYNKKGAEISSAEVFVSDGAKSDVANILDIFASGNTVLVPDPVYPVYVDTNIMAGNKIVYASGNIENNFLPMPDENVQADIIYICSPNNPTGAVYSAEQLKKWVDYATAQNAVILYDSAYEAFICEDLPTSIFQIEGAKNCAIEFGSLSKSAGFTGTRCAYTIVPTELERDGMNLHKLWSRRQNTKYNQLPYIIQRGAEAALLPEGLAQSKTDIDYYMQNAKTISDAISELGIWFSGGKNAPYVWLKCPNNLKSWDFFDLLLEKANVVGTPGAGFGSQGEGFLRLSAFANHENTVLAMKRVKDILG
ncbi:MAG: LL-diaminopimelate aminotransferase [Defluviitaleaceae bacterium]|nr:LL-diaminopimelate aminotransferase [Defluviitaleaceae bacterium]MCL2263692.1 LL-diaminopimelate aminotransferase [Defluviitaleaceae bacterium]